MEMEETGKTGNGKICQCQKMGMGKNNFSELSDYSELRNFNKTVDKLKKIVYNKYIRLRETN